MQLDAQSRDQHKRSLVAEVLRTAGTLRLSSRGHSMLPTLWPGDLLAIDAQSFTQVQVGDVVLYTRDERFYIHRVLRKNETAAGTSLLTRGDAMPEADAPIQPNELLGKVVSVERAGQTVPVTDCSPLRRRVGLMLAHSDRLRSLALRWHAWRSRSRDRNADLSTREVPLG